jgi:hypothetical protein
MESIVVATPWENKPKAFYYNQKVNCLTTNGHVKLNNETYEFNSSDSFGVLYWGRGVWTYRNTWYWGSASGMLNDKLFGFNIGYGFGDTSAASENIIFYEKIGHKIDEVEFHYDPTNYLAPWKFTSSDGRFEMTFEPIVDRNATVNLLIFKSIQHQVFGYFSGFAEEVYNRW